MIKFGFLLLLAVTFDFVNGMRDGGNFVSTVVSSRALSMRQSLALAAVAEFFGPFVFGVAVARTLGHGLIAPEAVTMNVILAALLGAVVWNFFTWWASIPSSSTHALIGGMLGAILVGAGRQAILVSGVAKILLYLFVSPLLGLVVSYLLTRLMHFMSTPFGPGINTLYRRLQVITEAILALSYGANDAQKTMGLIPLGMVTTGLLSTFSVPVWVILLSAGVTGLGIFLGGQRLARTLGGRFYKIRPLHGFSAQLSATLVIVNASLMGGPLSSSQVITASILGAGSAERINQVRWALAWHILESWLLTIPMCALLSAGGYGLLAHIFP
jgi:inorganic phosphate transporter, PiT family